MAHVVGVPKREPCQKCALPVFLAERLTVGKHVYHRTCLKCARCSSQLTPGSFYETETDGEFCCETCPDEEKSLGAEDDAVVLAHDDANKTSAAGVRSSIADRLAFFESSNDDKKLLQKSVSDEEKSKSLKKMNEASTSSPFKMNSALSTFMNSTLNDATDSAGASSRIDTSDSSDDDEEEEESISEAPQLPTTLPPTVLNSKDEERLIELPVHVQQPLDTKDTTLSTETVNNTENSPKERKTFVVSVQLDTISSPPKMPSEEISETVKIEQSPSCPDTAETNNIITSPVECNLSEITKDNSENDKETRTIIANDTEVEDSHPSDEEILRKPPVPVVRQKSTNLNDTDEMTTNRLSVVRARLNQFEVIAKKSTDSLRNIDSDDSLRLNSDLSTKNDDRQITTKTEEIVEEKVPEIEIESIEMTEEEKIDNSKDNKNASDPDNNKGDDIEEKEDISAETAAPIESVISEPEKSNQGIIYPDDLNPFGSDDEGERHDEKENVQPESIVPVTPAPRKLSTASSSTSADKERRKSLNPFDSSDDEIEVEKAKMKPPRPPPPKISKNPFGSESENEESSIVPMKTPVPIPRITTSSKTPTPEPTPRLSKQTFNVTTPLNNSGDYYGSSASLSTPYSLHRDSDGRGSSNSLTSSTGTIRSRKAKKAPAPPPPVKELFPSSETISSGSKKSTPSSSTSTTPHQPRKKRLAPPPPKPARLDPSHFSESPTGSKNLETNPLQTNSQLDKLSDEEKALLEGTPMQLDSIEQDESADDSLKQRRLIALDVRIIEDADASNDIRRKEEENVVYRRKIVPLAMNTPTDDHKDVVSHNRQLEKLKDNKEANNRNRQSHVSLGADDADTFLNKSSHGKWKRRKGPAPALPIPQRKVLQMLPLQEIRHELDIIEVQQLGLEKQGVILETMIRERCEGKNGELDNGDNGSKAMPNTKEVEDLILQLFELVNEKNELFRRQAELMYLRRQHRLEQEQADLEYEIRVLMAQPERNKTDSDKAREEALIARMVEVVQLRNDVIECLEMDRLREAEEDLSIKQQLEMHSAKRDEALCNQTPTKLSKKEKKKQKEIKKLGKSKKLDADKDADESEMNTEKLKAKKKKKKFLF